MATKNINAEKIQGNLSITSVSATTISATTYQNLPTDIRVTGGTYSTGTATFTNNTGGTFSVTGFSTGGAANFSSTVFVSTLGSDSTGVKYNVTQPFQTIGAAVSAATTGDTIYVAAGTYNETGIFKDGVNYYFLNGAIIVPPTGTTTPVFQVVNPLNDVNIDGFLTINTGANHTVFDLSGNTNSKNYYINFKQITATNITGSDGAQPRTVIRFINASACYAKINGDIRLTSVLGNITYATLSTIGDGTNLTYNGNIISTSTSSCIYRNIGTNNTFSQYNGIFSSNGAVATIRINSGGVGVSDVFNGTIYNASTSNGSYAFSNNGAQYNNTTINSNVYGNVYITNSYSSYVTINGEIYGYNNNPTYILLNGLTTQPQTYCTINGNVLFSSFVVQGGYHKINGNVQFGGSGNYPSQGCYTQTGGVVRWNAFSQQFGTGTKNTVTSSITSGGKLVVQKGSVFQMSELNSALSATQHGLLLSGGTLQLEGVLDYGYSGNTTSNLAAINFQAGTLVLDGGRIINRLNSANAISILSPAGTTNTQIFNNSFANVITSGGTITNTITGGGSLVIYSGITL